MTGEEIAAKALSIIRSNKYVYWYGAKGEKCIQDLLFRLAAANPSVYTTSYVNACLRDIRAGKYAVDCSGFVSMVYGWGGLGTYGISSRSDTHKCEGEIKNGMICWRPSHCGIYYNGYILEARGKAYGLCSGRKYLASDWECIYYVDGVDYGTAGNNNSTGKKRITEKIVNDVIAGKYGNGQARISALSAAGYTESQIKDIQVRVNARLKG